MAWTDEFTATAISAEVRSGRSSATAAVVESLDRIAARDPALRAFVVVRSAAALAEAAEIDARGDRSDLPLAGVPIAIKDNVAVAGEPLRIGSAATSAAPSLVDHPVVARLRAAGAVVVGITAVPELCIWGSTDSPGVITRNPWNPDRTTGGSSGGSAASVAAGMVPIAHGADGMGSIRVPAACCRLFGIKPGSGLVPAELGHDSWFGVAENGVLATTVQDAALVLSVLSDGRVPAAVIPPTALRIAVAIRSPLAPLRTDRSWTVATREIADLLADLGHSTRTAAFRYPVLTPIARWTAGPAVDGTDLDRKLLQGRSRTHLAVGRTMLRLNLVRSGQVDRLRARMERFFADFDVVITPTLGRSPGRAGFRSDRSWLVNAVGDIGLAPYTAHWNVLGWPAASVPAGWHPGTGTPLAVQLAAPPGGEQLILSLAAQIEHHRPWPLVAPTR